MATGTHGDSYLRHSDCYSVTGPGMTRISATRGNDRCRSVGGTTMKPRADSAGRHLRLGDSEARTDSGDNDQRY